MWTLRETEVMTQVLEFLPLIWETRIEFPGAGPPLVMADIEGLNHQMGVNSQINTLI